MKREEKEIVTNRWAKIGLLEELEGGVPEELGKIFECEKEHWIFENTEPPIHCMPTTFKVIE